MDSHLYGLFNETNSIFWAIHELETSAKMSCEYFSNIMNAKNLNQKFSMLL